MIYKSGAYPKIEMPHKISVVIPVYNSENTLGECLASVYRSAYKNYEVIAVDDCSTDKSVEVIKKFPCRLIRQDRNGGAGKARNAGAKHATGDILLFMDSDVLIRKDTLALFKESFDTVKEASAVQSVYSNYVRGKSFANTYKMLYLRHSFMKVRERFVPTIASYCAAVKKEVFDALGGFNEKIPSATTEDDEFGHRLIKRGYNIFLDKRIECDHIVSLSLKKIIRRDFKMASAILKSILRNENHEFKQMLRDGKFSTNTGFDMIASPIVAGLILVSGIAAAIGFNPVFLAIFLSSNVLFLAINRRFLKFIREERGLIFAIKSFFFMLADMAGVAFAGITVPIEFYVLNKKY